MNEIDDELAKFIETAIGESNNYCEALDKVIEWQKKNRDLIGLRIGTPIDVICGQRDVQDPLEEANKIAYETLMTLIKSARGELKEVTKEELEKM